MDVNICPSSELDISNDQVKVAAKNITLNLLLVNFGREGWYIWWCTVS